MKFELEPYNHGLGDDELLDDLRSVAQQLAKDYVTRDEYDKLGRLCSTTLQKRFGSWCKANELAGLKRIRNYQATADDCIADLKRVAAILGKDYVTIANYKIYGKFSDVLISRRIGSWKQAIEKAELKLSPQYHEAIIEEELFENLEQLWERLGRQPARKDFIKPLSRYSYDTYSRRFGGSYRKALEAFITSFQDEKVEQKPISQQILPVKLEESSAMIHKTPRNISWRLRFVVMQRDNFKCKACGRSPATDPSIILHVDHIKAWANGGETVLENLQTLCSKCNIGKSDLE